MTFISKVSLGTFEKACLTYASQRTKTQNHRKHKHTKQKVRMSRPVYQLLTYWSGLVPLHLYLSHDILPLLCHPNYETKILQQRHIQGTFISVLRRVKNCNSATFRTFSPILVLRRVKNCISATFRALPHYY